MTVDRASSAREDDFEGSTVIVTGAGRGQGATEAERFVAAGAHVVVSDIDEAAGAVLADELGARARFVRHDVSSEGDWKSLLGSVGDWPPVKVLVNNAGVHWFGALEDESAEALTRMLQVNLVGAQIGIRHVIGPMREAGGGSIVNVCSVLAGLGSRSSSSYVASKWGLRGLTKAAAMELGQWGIRVNAVHPGYIETPMLAAAAGRERPADYYDYLPLRRPGTTDEVADLVLYLASDRSSYLTGADFTVDGGMTAGSGPR
jgi:3alpha(or 20beta)-hydroxysteroid dehydrogenase